MRTSSLVHESITFTLNLNVDISLSIKSGIMAYDEFLAERIRRVFIEAPAGMVCNFRILTFILIFPD